VRHYHTEGFLDPQVKGAVHALSDVPTRAQRRLAMELPNCASPSSIFWHASRVAACSSSSSC
jgi:hypothetical protein